MARPKRFRLLRGAVAVIGVSLSSPAVAQVLPVELSWDAPEECPVRSDVLSRVRELVGTAADNAPVVRAQGEIKRVGSAYELRLSTEEEGQRGERLVRSAKCADLKGVAAVTLTLLLTSGRQDEPAPAPPSTAAPPPSTAPPPVPVPPTTDTSNQTRTPSADVEPRSWRLLLAAPQLAIQLGPLPKPSPKLSIGVGIEGAWWSVRVLGQWGEAQRVASSAQGYGARSQRDTLGLWACTEHRRNALSVAPCLHVSLARLHVEGYGPALRPEAQTKLSGSVGVGVIGRARLTPWLALMAGVAGQLELARPELWIDPSTARALDGASVGQVRRLAPVSALVVVGPEWIF